MPEVGAFQDISGLWRTFLKRREGNHLAFPQNIILHTIYIYLPLLQCKKRLYKKTLLQLIYKKYY